MGLLDSIKQRLLIEANADTRPAQGNLTSLANSFNEIRDMVTSVADTIDAAMEASAEAVLKLQRETNVGTENLEAMEEASRGLVTETDLLTVANAALRSDFALQADQLDDVAKFMLVLRDRGAEQTDVVNQLSMALREANVDALEEFGVKVEATSGTMEAQEAIIKRIQEEVGKMSDDFQLAGEDVIKSQVSWKNATDDFKDAIADVVSAMGPLLGLMAELLSLAAKLVATVAETARDAARAAVGADLAEELAPDFARIGRQLTTGNMATVEQRRAIRGNAKELNRQAQGQLNRAATAPIRQIEQEASQAVRDQFGEAVSGVATLLVDTAQGAVAAATRGQSRRRGAGGGGFRLQAAELPGVNVGDFNRAEEARLARLAEIDERVARDRQARDATFAGVLSAPVPSERGLPSAMAEGSVRLVDDISKIQVETPLVQKVFGTPEDFSAAMIGLEGIRDTFGGVIDAVARGEDLSTELITRSIGDYAASKARIWALESIASFASGNVSGGVGYAAAAAGAIVLAREFGSAANTGSAAGARRAEPSAGALGDARGRTSSAQGDRSVNIFLGSEFDEYAPRRRLELARRSVDHLGSDVESPVVFG